jgi:thioredoxin-like negative regulator of GroEL
MSELTVLTDITFPEFVCLHRFALVHFWAPWNGYDLEMRKIIESQLRDDLSERVAFGSLEIDPAAHHEICRQHKLLNVPFLAFYRDGALVHTSTGLLTAEVLILRLRELVT